ncbi:Uncharacterised protein [Vibrio cholerae]|nr:Uncharacterised protein [Vibrio cholerae]
MGKLSGFTEADWQHARRQRIKRASMSRFFSAIEAFNLLQSVVGRDTCRLIQQNHTVDNPTFTSTNHYASSSSRPASCLRRLSLLITSVTRFDIRIPSTKVLS